MKVCRLRMGCFRGLGYRLMRSSLGWGHLRQGEGEFSCGIEGQKNGLTTAYDFLGERRYIAST